MTEHQHDYPEPSPTVERVVVTRITFRRGHGCCDQSPVRMVTAYYEEEGLLVEFDPAKETA